MREEFEAGTNPVDPTSHPDVALKLRVTHLTESEFPFTFSGVQESTEGKVFALRCRDGTKERFICMNETVPDRAFPGFKIIAYHVKTVTRIHPDIIDKSGQPWKEAVDVEQLTLQRGDEAPLIFVKGAVTRTGEFSAKIFSLLSKENFEVKEGTIFALGGHSYKVLKVKPEEKGAPDVQIQRVDAEALITLKASSSAELEQSQVKAR